MAQIGRGYGSEFQLLSLWDDTEICSKNLFPNK